MDIEKILFKIDEMEYVKYSRNAKEQNIKSIEVPQTTCVRLSEVSFKENIVSRIDIFKFHSDKEDSIFVVIFMGNIEISTQIFYSDIVIDIEYNNDAHGKRYIRDFYIREARSYDYFETKKETL